MLRLERLEDRFLPSSLFLDLSQVAMWGPLTFQIQAMPVPNGVPSGVSHQWSSVPTGIISAGSSHLFGMPNVGSSIVKQLHVDGTNIFIVVLNKQGGLESGDGIPSQSGGVDLTFLRNFFPKDGGSLMVYANDSLIYQQLV